MRTRENAGELHQLIQQARAYDKRGDKFEKMTPVANMDFDRVPVVR